MTLFPVISGLSTSGTAFSPQEITDEKMNKRYKTLIKRFDAIVLFVVFTMAKVKKKGENHRSISYGNGFILYTSA